jgi:hypothetical protein
MSNSSHISRFDHNNNIVIDNTLSLECSVQDGLLVDTTSDCSYN